MTRHKDEKGRFTTEYAINYDVATDLYINGKMSVAAVAEYIGVSAYPIYRYLREHGLMRVFGETRKLSGAVKREKNSNWKGGKTIKHGYVMITIDGKQVYEHRVVAEEILGRRLTRNEVVHHKDGNTQNNFPDNLEVFQSHSEHMQHHITSEEGRRRGALRKYE